MLVIAENLNTRNRAWMEALRGRDASRLKALAQELQAAGAELINVQCSLDGSGDEELLPWAAGVIQEAVELPLCLDSRNTRALKAALQVLKEPPLVNYLSYTEPEDREALLELVARHRASLVLRASKGTIPWSFEAKLQILEELLQEAHAADIPNDRLFLDPSVVHILRGQGQEHLANARDCILALKEMVEPPVGTLVWVCNVSTGLHGPLRKKLEASFLLYLAGAGLDAAMVDVLAPELKEALYLIKSFRDEVVFSPADLA